MSSLLLERIASLEEVMLLPAMGIGSDHWQPALDSARSIILDLNSIPSPVDELGDTRWVKLVTLMQNLAYVNPDSGGVTDVALWCERQWATALQSDPDNIIVLQKLGHAWLLKSQAILARIDHNGSSSSSQDSETATRRSAFRRSATANTESDDASRDSSSDYIEARALLRPAIDFLDRAVNASDQQQHITGELLELAAEASMSFANVSHPRHNEAFYQKALALLLRASQIEGHEMNEHLKSFLAENLEFIH